LDTLITNSMQTVSEWKVEAKKVKYAIDFAIGSPEPELLDAYKDIFVERAE